MGGNRALQCSFDVNFQATGAVCLCMVPRLILCCAFSALAFSLQAAAPSFEWLAFGGGPKNDKIRAVTFDREGCAFLAGETTEDGTFGGLPRQGAGSMDLLLAKVSPSGQVLWVRSFGGTLIDRAYGVVTDAAGHAYVTGHFQSVDARAAGQLVPNEGDYDIHVAKYSPEGELLWLRTAGGAGYDYGHGIALDGAGDVIVAGAVTGQGRFGETVVNAGSTARAFFVAKYRADGELRWVRASEGRLSGSAHGVDVDAQGCIYLGGNGSGVGSFGGMQLDLGPRSSLVLKLSPEGLPVWSAMHAGAGAHEIAVDAAGRVWAAGMFKGEAVFGTEKTRTSGPNDNDGFLCHYNAEGRLEWTRVLRGPGTDYCLGVVAGEAGLVYVTGEFSGTASFAGHTLVSAGSTDVYTAAFHANGDLQWIIPHGGPRGDNAYSIARHRSGRLLIGGSCTAPAPFGGHVMDAEGGTQAYGATLKW